MFEGLREAVERNAERDELLQRFRPALARQALEAAGLSY
jgi:hypothetical protein